ncbi:MAG TPA: GNAT family N-acetyltransferase [Kiloniellaceae bacterium]|nr:GNAT family N-acetyltransferase [Kiloniellaceae bacterium]
MPDLRSQVEGLAGHSLHVSPASMGELMARADLAIGAAGTTSWERCCLGLPTVMLVLADNQRENARQLSAAGAAAVVDGRHGDLLEAIAAQLKHLDGDRAALHDMSLRASAVCDGQGALRARLSLLPRQTTKDGSGVLLRLAEADDEATLLRWQQQPAIRALARNPKIPTEAEHRVWFAARMTSESSFITMIVHGDEVAGMLRLDRLEPADRHEILEVSIVVDDRHRGVGVGLAALKQIRAWMPEVEFRAETLPDNHPSIALFRAAGYRALEGNLLHSTAA